MSESSQIEKRYKIGEVARLLGLPTSTLRYWEDSGLFISDRNPDNQYREYSMNTVLTIFEVAFFRNINISIDDMKGFFRLGLEDMTTVLSFNEDRIDREIRILQQQKRAIQTQNQRILDIVQIRQNPYKLSSPDMERGIADNLFSDESIKISVADYPKICIYFEKIDSKHPVFFNEVSEIKSDQKSIWDKNPVKYDYLETLLRFEMYFPENNNLYEVSDYLSRHGLDSNHIVGRYLATAFEDGKRWDYFKIWVEIPKHDKSPGGK